MKPDIAIQVENINKRYYVGQLAADDPKPWYRRLGRSLVSPVSRMMSTWQGKAAFAQETELWALKNVSFEVKQGEVVGIIGPNGSGKSTLLKILSRVIYPTSGVAKIRGEVGSLLEVGTGFHPELTGRENIYLNGAILGVTRADITRQFDQIVEFSGVGAFLDTPVKRYSSGMRVRLAFSVAVHLQPEIVLIDEVLSVGDAGFRKASLDKIATMAKQGRTVLLVSHNLQSIQQLTNRAIYMKFGQLIKDGNVDDVIAEYLNQNVVITRSENDNLLETPRENNVVSDDIRFRQCLLIDEDGEPLPAFDYGQPLRFKLQVVSKIQQDNLNINFVVADRYGTPIAVVNSEDSGVLYSVEPGQSFDVIIDLPELFLTPGTYSVNLSIREHIGLPFDFIKNAVTFDVFTTRYNQDLPLKKAGYIVAKSTWSQSSLIPEQKTR